MNRLRATAAVLAISSVTATAACTDSGRTSHETITTRSIPAASHSYTAPGRAAAALERAVAKLATTRSLTATARIGRSRLILRATSPTRHKLRAAEMPVLANLDLAVEHHGHRLFQFRRVDYPENGYAATEWGVRFFTGTDRDGELLNASSGSGLLLARLFGYDKSTGRLYVHRLFIKLLGFLSSPRVSVHRAGTSSMGRVFKVRANALALARVTAIGVAAGLGMGHKIFRRSVAQYVPNHSVSLHAWVRHGRLSRLSIGGATVRFRQSADRIGKSGEYAEADDSWLVDHIRDVFARAF